MYISIDRLLPAIGLFLLSTIVLQHPAPRLWAATRMSPHQLTASSNATEEQLLIFADQLMHEGEFFRAVTEYRRFLFTYPFQLG